ncbi:hypothetical protein [Nocardia tengchongensis]
MLDTATTFDSDETRWVVPDEWGAAALPARGVGTPQPVVPDITAVAAQAGRLDTNRDRVQRRLDHTAEMGVTDLAEVGDAALHGIETCSPLGAAVLSLALDLLEHERLCAADAWVSERGLVFATEAAVLRASLYADPEPDPSTRLCAYVLRRHPHDRAGDAHDSDNLFRMRVFLAGAPEDEYRAAVARMGELRTAPGGAAIRVATSFLAPTEQHWTAEDFRDFAPGGDGYRSRFMLLTASVTSRTDLRTLLAGCHPNEYLYGEGESLLYTALTRFGPECAGAISRMLRYRDLGADQVAALARILSRFPTDEAFAALQSRIEHHRVAAALIDAAQRFPHRALRLLVPEAAGSPITRHLLRAVAHAHPNLTAQLPTVVGYAGSAQAAKATELPDVLRTPPWRQVRSSAEQVVIADLAPNAPDSLDWQPGERDEWGQTHVWISRIHERDWVGSLANALAAKPIADIDVVRMLAMAPAELVRPLLPKLRPDRLVNADDCLRRILGRFDEQALPFVLCAVRSNPANLADALAPVTGSTVTLMMIRWLDGKNTRTTALRWLDRHTLAALPILISTALAAPGKDRRYAQAALRLLAEGGRRGDVELAAAAFDERVAAAISAMLDANPVDQLPGRVPTIPKWLVPELLPVVSLRDAKSVLPASAARDACIMLAMCGPNGDYAGITQLIASTEPGSLAEFAWGVFEAWRLADYPPSGNWVLHALGLVGDDETARRLAPLIRTWADQSAPARAATGLNVLAALGTDVALIQLDDIAENAKHKSLRTKAKKKFAEVAAALDLTPNQLADRMAPEKFSGTGQDKMT